MFPIIPIESFYRSKIDGLWLDDEYPAVASLCEEWLLSFATATTTELQVGDLKPAGKAIKILKQQMTDYSNQDRLDFAIAMALSIPNENTGKLFEAYCDTIDQKSYEIGDHVLEINNKIQAHPKVDVHKAFSHLPGREFYAMARLAYMTEIEHVRLQAVARDNVGVFKWTLPEDHYKAQVVAYTAMLSFPIDPTSDIYKSIVTDGAAEKILFMRQVSQLRHIASTMDASSDEVYGFLRPTPEEMPLLEPFGEIRFTEADTESFTFAHKEPDFARKLMRDAYRVTGCFFDLVDDNLRGHCDGKFVHEVTQAFMDAGLSASYLMSTGVCGRVEGDTPVTLKHALDRLIDMGTPNWKFYSCLYQEFLKAYSTEEIIANSEGAPGVIQALHYITGDKVYIEAASDMALSQILETELGL